MIVWLTGAYLNNLAVAMRNRYAAAGVTDVAVFTAPVGAGDLPDRALVFIGAETTETPAALRAGAMRNEEETILSGVLQVREIVGAGEGGGEVAAVAARQTALDRFAHLETEVRTTPNHTGVAGALRSAYISGKRLTQGIDQVEGGRVAAIEFDLTIKVRTDVTW